MAELVPNGPDFQYVGMGRGALRDQLPASESLGVGVRGRPNDPIVRPIANTGHRICATISACSRCRDFLPCRWMREAPVGEERADSPPMALTKQLPYRAHAAGA